MKIDREFQKRILEACSESYPGFITTEAWDVLTDDVNEGVLAANLAYLYQHELMDQAVVIGIDGHFSFNLGGMCCTEKGMDFLADDGGLGAILGVVTIKLHEETIQSLIETKILQSDLPQQEKNRLTEGLKKLSGEAIKHLTMKLIDQGLDHWPSALHTIGTFLR